MADVLSKFIVFLLTAYSVLLRINFLNYISSISKPKKALFGHCNGKIKFGGNFDARPPRTES